MTTCLKPKALLLSTAFSLLLLPATQAMAQTDTRSAEPEDAAGQGDTEIVVTARKQSESSLDVPMGLTALSGEQLASEQSYRLEDFVGKVPGLSMTETVGAQLVIRGIASTAFSLNAPVATYIDDTPLVGVGGFSGGSSNTPNLDTFDLNRIEVLKGPQGTLYGASAMGGVLKYVTNAPDPSGFAAKMQGGLSSTAHSDDGFGHNLHGMINVPFANNLAFRAVAYHNEYQGYIDNPSRDLEDINDMRVYGGRASLLWEATPDLSIRLSALNQQRRWDGMGFVEVVPGSLAPVTCTFCQARTGDQPGASRLQLYNLTVNWDVGAAALTSSTTYDKWRFDQAQNLVGLDSLASALKGGSYAFVANYEYWGDDVTHETRLASSGDKRLNWQVGIYYNKKTATNNQTYLAFDRVNEAIELPELGGSLQPTTYKELAGFGNVNFEVTPEFDVSVGARFSDQSQTFSQSGRGIGAGVDAPLTKMEDSVFTWSTDARWRFIEDSMVYARVAKGFVPGGPNVAPPFPIPDFPLTFKESTTTNYEIGYKGSLLDNALTVELAAFLIDFDDIQVFELIPPQYNAATNASTARSKGFEWSFIYKPVIGLTLGFNGAYTDAKLTKDPPPSVVGRAGDPLPTSAKWQLAGSADYRWPMLGIHGVVGADWRYLSRRPGELVNWTIPGVTRQFIPGYHTVDLRAGIEADRWRLSLYVKNVGNSKAISYAYPEAATALYRAFRLTPRTFGVDLSFDF